MPNRYPKVAIRSKNELAKRISRKDFSFKEALALINDVRANFSRYWKDNEKESKPEDGKYVRSAAGKPLGVLLKKINTMVLKPHDKLLPSFIFGGISGLDHVHAAASLIGKKRKRTLLKADIKKFFEQVRYDMVVSLFKNKCQCTFYAAKWLADLCCIPLGPKGSGSDNKSIARGFATSSRLAVWCNLEIFLKLDRLIKKRLKGHDPRLMIFVDDIGITASRVPDQKMEEVYGEVCKLFNSASLPLNEKKKKIRPYSHRKGMVILGSRIERNSLSISGKTLANLNRIKNKLKKQLSPEEKKQQMLRRRSIMIYKKRVENITKLK